MADQPKNPDTRTLEMRVAELEDKLSKVHITEDEMKAFQKVSALIGQAPDAAAAGPTASASTIFQCITQCIVRQCTIARHCTIVRLCTIINQCQCINECGGGGGGFNPTGGGGFGSLGG